MSAPAWNRRRRNTRRDTIWRAYQHGRGPAVALERSLNASSPGGPSYFDTAGRPCGLGTWSVLLEYGGEGVRRIADTTCRTPAGPVRVSTVWLGVDYGWGQGPPVLWESMAFGPEPWANPCWRYASADAARRGHAQVVAAVRAGGSPDDVDA